MGVCFDVLDESGFVYPRHGKHDRCADHLFFGVFVGWRASAESHVSIPRGIDNPFGEDGLSACLTLDDDALDAVSIHNRGDE